MEKIKGITIDYTQAKKFDVISIDDSEKKYLVLGITKDRIYTCNVYIFKLLDIDTKEDKMIWRDVLQGKPFIKWN